MCVHDSGPSFCSGAGAYMSSIVAALHHADIVVENEDEVRAATGLDDPRQGIVGLRALGQRVLILKRGGEGAALYDGDRVVEVPPVHLAVVNGLSAADAFLAALTHGLLPRIDL